MSTPEELADRWLAECCYQIRLLMNPAPSSTNDTAHALVLAMREELMPYLGGMVGDTLDVLATTRGRAFRLTVYFEHLEDALKVKINPLALKIFRKYCGWGNIELICPPNKGEG